MGKMEDGEEFMGRNGRFRGEGVAWFGEWKRGCERNGRFERK